MIADKDKGHYWVDEPLNTVREVHIIEEGEVKSVCSIPDFDSVLLFGGRPNRQMLLNANIYPTREQAEQALRQMYKTSIWRNNEQDN